MMDLAMPSANSWFGIRLMPDVLQPAPRNDLPGLGAGSDECGDVEKMQWIAGSGGTSRGEERRRFVREPASRKAELRGNRVGSGSVDFDDLPGFGFDQDAPLVDHGKGVLGSSIR